MQIVCSVWLVALATIFLADHSELTSSLLPVFLNGDSVDVEQYDFRAENDKTVLNYRLPNDTYPEHYALELTTNVHTGDRAFKGKVIIDIVVVKNTSSIVLHARQLKISKVTITSQSTGVSEELSNEYESEREFLILKRKNPKQLFATESKWKLHITYSGQLRKDNRGFYMSTYTDDLGKERFLATTQFESTDARHGFPCYDEPAKGANFTITINHSPSYSAISNMPVNEALSSPGKTVFLTTARIPTYIVAFIVSDFVKSGGILNNLPQHVHSRYNANHTHEWAVMSGMLITERLSKYYGVDFMLPKLDHVAVPDFAAGGMENWGLATYREEYLLYDEKTSTVFTQTSIANVLAHEICHQWFGDYVPIKWWTYLWLKEGFATLFSYKALDEVYPEWGIWQQFHISEYRTALITDGRDFPRPMTHYVEKPTDIGYLYDSVSYAKAGSVLYMWNNALTEKVFQQGLHNYLTTKQYSAAVEEDLFTAIQNAAKEKNYKIPATVSEMMSTWTRQGGCPMITVTRNYEDGTFTLKQEAFHDDETIKDNKTWYVPINYAVASNPNFHNAEATHYLLNVTEMKINAKIAKEDWLVLNKQSAYYYRIKYDTKNYNLITESLIKRPFVIHPRNRAQLMHDAYHLTASNRLDDVVLLNMLTYLQKEDQYAPWSIANTIITTYNRYLYGDYKYDDLKFFISDQITPIYERLGVHDIPGEQHYQKYTRNIVINLACLAGIKSCLEETNNKLKAIVKYNTPVEPNLQGPIYCNGFKQSGDEEFNFAYEKLMSSADQAIRSQIISSLGCSQNENHIKKFIFSSIDETNELRTHERSTLLRPVYSRSEEGLLACIEFLNENWDAYGNLKTGRGNPLENDIRGISVYVVNKNQEEKLLALVAKVKNSKHVQDTLESYVKKSIADNFDWLKENRDPIMTWMTQYRVDKMGGGSASLSASIVLVTIAFITALNHLF